MTRTTPRRKSRARDDRRKPIQIERDIEAELDDEYAERLQEELAEATYDPELELWLLQQEAEMQSRVELANHQSGLCAPSCSHCRAARDMEDAQWPSGIEEILDWEAPFWLE